MSHLVFPNAGRDGASPQRTFNVTRVNGSDEVMVDVDASRPGLPVVVFNTLTRTEAHALLTALLAAMADT